MAKKTTATVSTLEARVHVLLVGNRQVTVSVFNQLDWVHSDRIKLMGRVNGRDGTEWAIGKDKRDGCLVRCQQKIIRYEHLDGTRHRPDTLSCMKCEDNGIAEIWEFKPKMFNNLPLIVLAGLR